MDQFQVIDHCLMVKLPQELDQYQAGYFSREADSFLLRPEVCHVVFDFEDTEFMDSSGIAVIVRVSRRMQILGGRTWIEDPARQPQRVIDAAGIDRLVPIAVSKMRSQT